MGLFDDLKFYISQNGVEETLIPKVKEIITSNGGRLATYLTDTIDMMICDLPNSDEIYEAEHCYEKPVVTHRWLIVSVQCGLRLPYAPFSTEAGSIFKGLVICASQLTKHDADTLWTLVIVNGGSCQKQWNNATTHLLCPTALGDRFQAVESQITQNKLNIKLVTPDWVNDCVKMGKLLDELAYHPKLMGRVDPLANHLHQQQLQLANQQQQQAMTNPASVAPSTPGGRSTGSAGTPVPPMRPPSSALSQYSDEGKASVNSPRFIANQAQQLQQHGSSVASNSPHAGVKGGPPCSPFYPGTPKPSGTLAMPEIDAGGGVKVPLTGQFPNQPPPGSHTPEDREAIQNLVASFKFEAQQIQSYGGADDQPPTTTHQPKTSSGGQAAGPGSPLAPLDPSRFREQVANVAQQQHPNRPPFQQQGMPIQGHLQHQQMYVSPGQQQPSGGFMHPQQRASMPPGAGYPAPPGQQMYDPGMRMMGTQQRPQHFVPQGSYNPQQQYMHQPMTSPGGTVPASGMVYMGGTQGHPQQGPPQSPHQMGYNPQQSYSASGTMTPRSAHTPGPSQSFQFPPPSPMAAANPPMSSPYVMSPQKGMGGSPRGPSAGMRPPSGGPRTPAPEGQMYVSMGQQQQISPAGYPGPSPQGGPPMTSPQQQPQYMPMSQPAAQGYFQHPVQQMRPQMMSPGAQRQYAITAEQQPAQYYSPASIASTSGLPVATAPPGMMQNAQMRQLGPPPTSMGPVGQVVPRPGPFAGHDPSVAVPAEMCLAGCVFVIVDYERILDQKEVADWRLTISQHGGEVEQSFLARVTHVICESLKHPTVQQAIKDGKRCVTAQWLNDCLIQKKMVPPWKAIHFPSSFGENRPCKDKYFTVTGFTPNEKSCLRQMIFAVGGKYTTYLCKKNYVLVAKRFEGPKVTKAMEWSVPVANVQWLTDIMLGVQMALQNMKNQKYQNFLAPRNAQQQHMPEIDLFQIDINVWPHLMGGWRQPVTINNEVWNSAIDRKRALDNDDGKIYPWKKIKLSPAPEDHEIVTRNVERPNQIKFRVLFSGLYAEEVQNCTKKLFFLGGEISHSVGECTHIISNDLKRTLKILKGIALGKPIVTPAWIKHSYRQATLLNFKDFLVKDEGNERFFGFNLKLTLRKAKEKKLFENMMFYMTPSVAPSVLVIKEVIQASGGYVLPQRPCSAKLIELQQKGTGVVVISCENDMILCENLVTNNIALHSPEFVLTGVLRQEIDMNAYRIMTSSQAAR